MDSLTAFQLGHRVVDVIGGGVKRLVTVVDYLREGVLSGVQALEDICADVVVVHGFLRDLRGRNGIFSQEFFWKIFVLRGASPVRGCMCEPSGCVGCVCSRVGA